MATYSSTTLQTIGEVAKSVTNYHLFSLDNTLRSKVIALGIRKQRTINLTEDQKEEDSLSTRLVL